MWRSSCHMISGGSGSASRPARSAGARGWTTVIIQYVLLAVFLLSVDRAVVADEEPTPADKAKKEEISRRHLELMKSAIDELQVSSKGRFAGSGAEIRQIPAPALQRRDAAGFLDAGVWRVGEKGRPTGFVTIELYRAEEGMALLTHEFISLSQASFSMVLPVE